jgi:hypothetical protein
VDLLDAPGKARIYTKLDLRHTYHLCHESPRFYFSCDTSV